MTTKVTPADLEAEIASEFYFTADEGVYGHEVLNAESVSTPDPAGPLGRVTICTLVLRNGLTLVGVNEGPVDPAGFDPELGRKYAREKAIDQLWPMLGYQLAQRLREG